jgi:uncharacterized damage-inducible protein DinB
MTVPECRLLFEYNDWANRSLMGAAARLSAELFVRELGASFGSVRGTLLHIVIGEWRWLQFWLDKPYEHEFPPADYPTADTLEAFRAEVVEAQRRFVAALTEDDLRRPRLVRGRDRPLADTLQHLLSHSTYHRGQVATLLRQLGQTPPTTDFLVFLAEQP